MFFIRMSREVRYVYFLLRLISSKAALKVCQRLIARPPIAGRRAALSPLAHLHAAFYCFLSSFNLSTKYVKQLGSDALLAQLVILKLQLFEQLLRIVVGGLHRHNTCGSFRGTVFGGHFLHHRVDI